MADAHFHLHGMLHEYHLPGPFRWELHAFVQAARSVVDVLRNELADRALNVAWLDERWPLISRTAPMAGFVRLRNSLVKRQSLVARSRADLCVLDEGSAPRVVKVVDPAIPSLVHLRAARDEGLGVGQLLALRREWIVEEIGEGPVLDLAHDAWVQLSDLLNEAHARAGFAYELQGEGGADSHGHGDVTVLVMDDDLTFKAHSAQVIAGATTFGHQAIHLSGEPTGCAVPMTHDRFEEAHYFMDRMLNSVHEPEKFRAYLNAFLQSLHSVTFVLQSECAHVSGWGEWYGLRQAELIQDPLLKRIAEARTFVAHRGSLAQRSRVTPGLFRGRRLKLATPLDLDFNIPSEVLLENTKRGWYGFLIDEEHSAIGEQLGVQREWFIDELGDGRVPRLVVSAWAAIGALVRNAHEFVGADSDLEELPEHVERPEQFVLLESDVDPNLPTKWGW